MLPGDSVHPLPLGEAGSAVPWINAGISNSVRERPNLAMLGCVKPA